MSDEMKLNREALKAGLKAFWSIPSGYTDEDRFELGVEAYLSALPTKSVDVDSVVERMARAILKQADNHGVVSDADWNDFYIANKDAPHTFANQIFRQAQAALKASGLLDKIAELEKRNEWLPIETAPKDGTCIIAWCVHDQAKFCDNPVKEGYAAVVLAYWTKHNGGGWVWDGLAGTFTHWQPLPTPPKQNEEV